MPGGGTRTAVARSRAKAPSADAAQQPGGEPVAARPAPSRGQPPVVLDRRAPAAPLRATAPIAATPIGVPAHGDVSDPRHARNRRRVGAHLSTGVHRTPTGALRCAI